MESLQDILFGQNLTEEKNSLICMVCKNHLSIPPILHNDALGSICGRENCTKLANKEGTSYRQSAYELLAKYLYFPCMHRENGCQEKLHWDEVGEHEKICDYTKFVCPFSTERFEHLEEFTCSWEGTASELSDHLDSIHPSHRFVDYVQFNLEKDIGQNQLFFSQIQGSIVIMFVIDRKSCFYLKVWSGPEIWKNLNYKAEILTERAEVNALKMRKPDLIQPSFLKGKINNSWFKVSFAYIKELFDSPTSLTIKFYVDGVVLGPSRKSYINNSLLLDDVKCFKCLEELMHPVYVCKSKNAHNICSKCIIKPNNTSITQAQSMGTSLCGSPIPSTSKTEPLFNNSVGIFQEFCTPKQNNTFGSVLCIQPSENSLCPECKSGVSRNFAYEKLKWVVNQSLQYCVLCYKKVDGLMNHVAYNHTKSIYQLDKCYSDFSLDHYFFLYDNHIFRLSKRFTIDNKLSFGVQCLEMKEIKFKYELQLMNTKCGYSSITFGNFCHPENVSLTTQENGFLLHETSIPHEVLRNIFPDINSIGFKLSISWL